MKKKTRKGGQRLSRVEQRKAAKQRKFEQYVEHKRKTRNITSDAKSLKNRNFGLDINSDDDTSVTSDESLNTPPLKKPRVLNLQSEESVKTAQEVKKNVRKKFEEKKEFSERSETTAEEESDEKRTPEDIELAYLEKKLGLTGVKSKEAKIKLEKEYRQDGFDDLFSVLEACVKAKESTSENDTDGISDRDEEEDEEEEKEENEEENEEEEDEGENDNLQKEEIDNLQKGEIDAEENNSVRQDAREFDSKEPPNCQAADTNQIKRAVEATLTELLPKLRAVVNRVSEGTLALTLKQTFDSVWNVAQTVASAKLKGRRFSPESLATELQTAIARQVAALIFNLAIANPHSTASLVLSTTAYLVALGATASPRILIEYLKVLTAGANKFLKSVAARCYKLRTVRAELQTNEARKAELDVVEDKLTHELYDAVSPARHSVESFAMLYDLGVIDPSYFTTFLLRVLEVPKMERTQSLCTDEPLIFEVQLDLLATGALYGAARLSKTLLGEGKKFWSEVQQILDCWTNKKIKGDTQKLSILLEQTQSFIEGKISKAGSERMAFIRSWFLQDSLLAATDWERLQISWDGEELTCGALGHAKVESGRLMMTATEGDTLAKRSAELEQLANKLRIAGPVRREILMALMTAADAQDALQNVLAAVAAQKNPGVAMEHVAAVAMHLTFSGREFNPFYSEVLCLLAALPETLGKKYQRVIRQGLAAQLNSLPSKLKLLAEFIVYLCRNPLTFVEMRIIRFLNFDDEKATDFVAYLVDELCSEQLPNHLEMQLTNMSQRHADIARVLAKAARSRISRMKRTNFADADKLKLAERFFLFF